MMDKEAQYQHFTILVEDSQWPACTCAAAIGGTGIANGWSFSTREDPKGNTSNDGQQAY